MEIIAVGIFFVSPFSPPFYTLVERYRIDRTDEIADENAVRKSTIPSGTRQNVILFLVRISNGLEVGRRFPCRNENVLFPLFFFLFFFTDFCKEPRNTTIIAKMDTNEYSSPPNNTRIHRINIVILQPYAEVMLLCKLNIIHRHSG